MTPPAETRRVIPAVQAPDDAMPCLATLATLLVWYE